MFQRLDLLCLCGTHWVLNSFTAFSFLPPLTTPLSPLPFTFSVSLSEESGSPGNSVSAFFLQAPSSSGPHVAIITGTFVPCRVEGDALVH